MSDGIRATLFAKSVATTAVSASVEPTAEVVLVPAPGQAVWLTGCELRLSLAGERASKLFEAGRTYSVVIGPNDLGFGERSDAGA